jgi:hypothetical protein
MEERAKEREKREEWRQKCLGERSNNNASRSSFGQTSLKKENDSRGNHCKRGICTGSI